MTLRSRCAAFARRSGVRVPNESRSVAEQTTRDPPKTHSQPAPPGRLVLTIALHPDVRRVGERAEILGLVGSGVAALSRLSPTFRSPGGAAAGPINDVYVSRSAI